MPVPMAGIPTVVMPVPLAGICKGAIPPMPVPLAGIPTVSMPVPLAGIYDWALSSAPVSLADSPTFFAHGSTRMPNASRRVDTLCMPRQRAEPVLGRRLSTVLTPRAKASAHSVGARRLCVQEKDATTLAATCQVCTRSPRAHGVCSWRQAGVPRGLMQELSLIHI